MAKSWHNQNKVYQYSEIYNNTTKITNIDLDGSTIIKYADSDGATRKSGGNTANSEKYCIYDIGSYYLNVNHQPVGTYDYSFEEDGGDINDTEINSYRVNGDNALINESYTVSSPVSTNSGHSVTDITQGSSNPILNIGHNNTSNIRTGVITIQQVYNATQFNGNNYTYLPALKCDDVEFTQRGKYQYRIVINLDSGYSNQIEYNGTTKYTCYLQRRREGDSWANVPASTPHTIDSAWSCSSNNITRDYGATVSGTIDPSNHYIYHITVTGCCTKYGTYSGNSQSTISTGNVTITVGYNGNIIYSGTSNSVASATQDVTVEGVHPYYDYRTRITTSTPVTICTNTSRGSYPSSIQITVYFYQCTCQGYINNITGWTSWVAITHDPAKFSWSVSNTTAATVNYNGRVSITNEYTKYHRPDTSTTVTAHINNGVINNQGVAWDLSNVRTTIDDTTEDHENLYYCNHDTSGNINIFGRADLYEYRCINLWPDNTTINDGDNQTFTILLQERKNGGATTDNQDGYVWQNYSTDATKFTWSGDGSIAIYKSVNTSAATFQGVNKNYYPGTSSETPGFISGTVTATTNFSPITHYDSMHGLNVTFTPSCSQTTSLKVRGHMSVYKFRVYISTPKTASICYNTSRSINKTSHTFTANLAYQYRVGTTDSYTWSSESTLTTTGSNFTWTSEPAATNYYTLSNGTCSNPSDAFALEDKSFTITATAISSVYNVYNIDSGSADSDTCTLTILGRADEYKYRVVIVENTSIVTINNGGTYQCNAKLQQSKNGGTWTDYSTNNSIFTWSISTSNGSLSVNTTGLATGTNKNYYLGKKGTTPGYTGGTNQSTPCQDKVRATYNGTISNTDTLHNCAALFIIDSGEGNKYATTAYIRTRGVLTDYCFYTSTGNLTPTTASICYNNSRTDVSGYSQSITFVATTNYKYKVGTTDSWSWSSEQTLETTATDYTWSVASGGSNSGYFTFNNGTCTCTYSSFDTSRTDKNFIIRAVIKSKTSEYNIANCGSSNTQLNGTLTVLAREDEFSCGPVTLNAVNTTIPDGQTAVVTLNTFKYYKNGDLYDAPSGSYTVTWNSWPDAPGTVSLIISSSSDTICNAVGTNRYYMNNDSLTNGYFYGYIEAILNYKQTYSFTGKFGRIYHLDCTSSIARENVLIRGHQVIYDYRNFKAKYPTSETIIEYNGSVGLTNSYERWESIGTVDDSPTNYRYESEISGFYARIVSGMTSNFSRSGSTITTSSSWRNNYSSIGYADLYLSISWNDPNGTTHNHNFPRIRAKPAPDKYELSWHIGIPYSMDDNTSSNYNLYVDLIKNGNQQISRWISTDFYFWADENSYYTGLESWEYNPPLNIHLVSVDLDWEDDDRDFDWEYSISASWGPYNDRNSDIYGDHQGNVIKSDSGTTIVYAPEPPSWTHYSDIYFYMKDESGGDISRWRVTGCWVDGVSLTSHSGNGTYGWTTDVTSEINYWRFGGGDTYDYPDTPPSTALVELEWEWEDNYNTTHYESWSETLDTSWWSDGGYWGVRIYSSSRIHIDIV